VLFASDLKLDIGEPIEYVIALNPSGDLDLHCLGKVTRLDLAVRNGTEPERPFEVAATVERYEFVRARP
jgi:hypothetical protein